MQTRNRLILLGLLIIVGVFVAFFLLRRDTRAQFGPAVALCPGPDSYGYLCEPGGAFAYINATEDTLLYADDGVTEIDLPFPFTFYGTTYTTLQASSNGTLQFGETGVPEYFNICLDDGPVSYMGDMLAPYWDDLDLSFAGYLETAVVGTAPNRIFVIEWDEVPRFGGDFDDTVTFAVQLFEENNDILFMYQDVTSFESSRGGSATIGLQSAAQGLSLQYSCNQPSVTDATGIHFPHPETPNRDLGLETAVAPLDIPTLATKGPSTQVLAQLVERKPDGLARLQAAWLAQTPPRVATWESVDVTGNGRDELLLLWQGGRTAPQLTELALFANGAESGPELLLAQRMSTRETAVAGLDFVQAADLTGDGIADVVLHDAGNGRVFVITAAKRGVALLPVPQQCRGNLGLFDPDGDGTYVIVRDGCEQEGRVTVGWNGRDFSTISE